MSREQPIDLTNEPSVITLDLTMIDDVIGPDIIMHVDPPQPQPQPQPQLQLVHYPNLRLREHQTGVVYDALQDRNFLRHFVYPLGDGRRDDVLPIEHFDDVYHTPGVYFIRMQPLEVNGQMFIVRSCFDTLARHLPRVNRYTLIEMGDHVALLAECTTFKQVLLVARLVNLDLYLTDLDIHTIQYPDQPAAFDYDFYRQRDSTIGILEHAEDVDEKSYEMDIMLK